MSRTRLRDHIAVACSVSDADSRLESFFARGRNDDGITHLTLRVPLVSVAGFSGLALEHGVRVRAWRDRDDQNLNDLIRIRWEPQGGGPYPAFEGTLVTWGESDPQRTFIELDGTYEPPIGAGGETFDAAVGHAIARRTARALLDDIARELAGTTAAEFIRNSGRSLR